MRGGSLIGIGIGGVTGALGGELGGRLWRSADEIDEGRLLRRTRNLDTGNMAATGQCHSFSADTDVSTPNGDLPISEVEIGDTVYAYDELTGEVEEHTVVNTFVHNDDQIVYLTIDGEEIETTPWHPFYTDEGWEDAGDLQPGDLILSLDGDYGVVESVVIVDETQTMYDLDVETVDTFAVGDGAWVVHNQNFSCPTYFPNGKQRTTSERFISGVDLMLGLAFNKRTSDAKRIPRACFAWCVTSVDNSGGDIVTWMNRLNVTQASGPTAGVATDLMRANGYPNTVVREIDVPGMQQYIQDTGESLIAIVSPAQMNLHAILIDEVRVTPTQIGPKTLSLTELGIRDLNFSAPAWVTKTDFGKIYSGYSITLSDVTNSYSRIDYL